jgi:hypothetical protein
MNKWHVMSSSYNVMWNFVFCWPCISIYACNETNLMLYLSSVYSVTIPLQVSGLLAAHHQEVTMYICNNWYVLYVLVDCQLAWMGWNWLCRNASSWFHYTLTRSVMWGYGDKSLGVQQPWGKLLTPGYCLISCTEFYFWALKIEGFPPWRQQMSAVRHNTHFVT